MPAIRRTLSAKRTAPGKLTHDHNGLQRERVSEIQRARMLAATAHACAERGAANLTVAHVVQSAGVSRRTFYEIFEDIEDCLLAAFDDGVERVAERVIPAYRSQGAWRERIRAALTAALELFDAEPAVGRLLVVEAPGMGVKALRRRQDVLARIVAAIEEGRRESKAGSAPPPAQLRPAPSRPTPPRPAPPPLAPPPLAGEGVVGAVFSIVHGRMLQGGAGSLLELVNPLMSIAVLPYLGAAASRRELGRPAPRSARRSRPAQHDPLKALDIRLTYRTVSVLAAVAAHPGSSNKGVGVAAGMRDQGQISKLLARLEKLGLVENVGGGAGRGEPNAWTLTQAGEDVRDAL